LGRQTGRFHRRYDVLLTPALATPPVKLGYLDMMMEDVDECWRRIERFTPFTVWFNMTGQPAMTLPVGETAAGLPPAVQAVARFGDEATLFRLAAQIEAARSWFHRRPPIVGVGPWRSPRLALIMGGAPRAPVVRRTCFRVRRPP
jgi:amidase